MLSNTIGSPQYEEFLLNLGFKINMNQHLGFLGGLNTDIDGQDTIYYADYSLELIFHVATMVQFLIYFEFF